MKLFKKTIPKVSAPAEAKKIERPEEYEDLRRKQFMKDVEVYYERLSNLREGKDIASLFHHIYKNLDKIQRDEELAEQFFKRKTLIRIERWSLASFIASCVLVVCLLINLVCR